MASKYKIFSRESRLKWGAEQKKLQQERAARIRSAIEIIQRDGYYHAPGTPAYKNIPCPEILPEDAELFEWNTPKDRLESIGKYVPVTKLDGTKVFAPIVKLGGKGTYIKTPLGMYAFKEWPDLVEKEDIHNPNPNAAQQNRDRLREVADRFIVTGSLVQALQESFPTRNENYLRRKVYQLSLSPKFKQMVSNKLQEALDSQGITAETLVEMRLELVNLAKEQKDSKELNNAIKGLEAMFTRAEEISASNEPQRGLVEGPSAIDTHELQKLKNQRGEKDAADDAEIIQEIDN